jgi:hypothetical protein
MPDSTTLLLDSALTNWFAEPTAVLSCPLSRRGVGMLRLLYRNTKLYAMPHCEPSQVHWLLPRWNPSRCLTDRNTVIAVRDREYVESCLKIAAGQFLKLKVRRIYVQERMDKIAGPRSAPSVLSLTLTLFKANGDVRARIIFVDIKINNNSLFLFANKKAASMSDG